MYRRDDVFWAVCHGAVLTNDAKDAQNVGSEYHQHVDEGEKNDSDGNVTQPVERLGGEQHLLDGSAYLQKETEGGGFSDNTDNTTIRYLASGGTNHRLTGNSTIGTVSVTAVRTATRTHRIKVSYGSIRL